MSQSINPLKSAKVVDPRVNFNVPEYFIHQGASQMTYKTINAISYSGSSVQFTCPPPNVNIAVDRKVFITMTLELEFDTTDPALLGIGSTSGPRSYPLSKICNNVSIAINNNTVTTNISDYADALLHYNNDQSVRQFELSRTPTMLDTMQDYRQFLSQPFFRSQAGPAGRELLGLGSARNPLASYGENSTENARGGFTGVVVPSASTGQNVKVLFTFTEPLFISPLLFGDRDSMGLYGIQTFDITLNMGNLKRCWSRAAATDLADPASSGANLLNVIIKDNPKARFCYLTPQINQVLSSDSTYSYPYYSIDRYSTSAGSAPGDLDIPAVGSTMSNNIQFSSIPRRIYVFLRRTNGDLDSESVAVPPNVLTTYPVISKTDTYARINAVSVNFNNRSGLLSGALSEDLYHMSVRNGLKSSWDQWNKYQGSVLCIDLARDLSLGPIEAPGVLGSYQFSIRVDWEWVAPKVYDPVTFNFIPGPVVPLDLYVVSVQEGTFVVKNQTTISQIGVVSASDVLNDPNVPVADYYLATMGTNYYGGAFMDTVRKYGKKALQGLNAALPTLSAIAPLLPGSTVSVPALKIAEKYLPKLIGAGVEEGEARKICGGGYSEEQIKTYIRHLKGRGDVGGMVVGGRMAPKNRMARYRS